LYSTAGEALVKNSIALAFIAFALCRGAGAAPVTWSFYETSILACGSPNACVLPPQPFVLLTLTLPEPTSAGAAPWPGGASTPVYTGDTFALSLPLSSMAPFTLTSAFAGNASNPGGLDCTNSISPRAICDFNISWSETADNLNAVSIMIDAVNDGIGGFAVQQRGFGLMGGSLASDGTLGGCGNTQCVVGGFWQSDLAVPEPISTVLLASGLLGTWLAARSRSEGRAPGQRDRSIGPWRTAERAPALPVSPVLSGRDQALPSPSIAILHPTGPTGAP
jgi:hypothetical protein